MGGKERKIEMERRCRCVTLSVFLRLCVRPGGGDWGGGDGHRCFISPSLYKEIIIYLVIYRSNKYSSPTITDEDDGFK